MNMKSTIATKESEQIMMEATQEHTTDLMDAFIRKSSQESDISADDYRILQNMIPSASMVKRGWHLFRERDAFRASFLILEGWAFRYKLLPNGKRQIVGFLLPGDLSDVHATVLERRDHNLAMLTSGRVAAIDSGTMSYAMDHYPNIARALNWSALVEQAVLREWLTSLGQRDAFCRIAHLICELWHRMRAAGLADGQSFIMPLTQTDLGDALGLSSVHVNRRLQIMRKAGLITLGRQMLTIQDPSQLTSLCGFDASYLQCGGIRDAWLSANKP